jgi:ATP-dependent Lon protease
VPDIYPIVNGKAISIQELREEMTNNMESTNNIIKIETELSFLQMELENTIRENNKLDKELKDELETLRRKTGTKILRNYIDEIVEKHWNPELTAYLLEVQKSIVSNLYLFTTSNGATKGSIQKLIRKSKKSKLYDKYRVNVILDNSDTDSCPIVIETSPSYTKTFGTIEKTITKSGIIRTDFTKIKAGSLLQANGGFFIVNANDIISDEALWNNLKKVLKYKKLEIKNIDGLLENTTSLKPEPIDINVKVIMIGDENLYNEIFNNDEDFQKIFKINAEFDYKTELNYSIINDYARFVKKICNEENLLPFDKGAVASILEECLRRTESQKYITTKFGEIADLIRESNYWAIKDSAKW